jgi:tetratricopeptide (TPR) repeat protein
MDIAKVNNRNGKVITFYSYKGGTGRSLLVANTALILASNNCRVLVVDWDLEAPGLHHYFRPFLTDPSLKSSLGLIDMLTAYWDSLSDQVDEDKVDIQHERTKWIARHLDIYQYAVTLNLPDMEGVGDVVFVPAGRQTPAYASKVGNFDWDSFYSEAGGKGLLDAFKELAIKDFDYVLIDSRTGVSDTSGICTVHLPDELVLCFTYNNQNVMGARGIANNVLKLRKIVGRNNSEPNSDSALRIFPVPTRVARDNKLLLEERQRYTWNLFADCVGSTYKDPVRDYWLKIEQPYEPDQSYVETFAFLTGVAGDPKGLLAAIEHVCARITDSKVIHWNNIFDSHWLERLRRSKNDEILLTPSPSIALTPAELSEFQAENIIHWKVLNRFVHSNGEDANRWALRSVPISALDDYLPMVDRLIRRGDLLVKSRFGGESVLELSSKYLVNKAALFELADKQKSQLEVLNTVERKTTEWLGARGAAAVDVASQGWLDVNERELMELRSSELLQSKEALFLNQALNSKITQRVVKNSKTVTIVLALLAALLFALGLSQFLKVGELKERISGAEDKLIKNESALKSLQLKALESERKIGPIASYGRGHESFAKADYQAAIQSFSEAIAGSPSELPDAYRARGVSYQRLYSSKYKPESSETTALQLREKMYDDLKKWLEQSSNSNRRLYAARLFNDVGNYNAALEQMESLDIDIKRLEKPLTASEFEDFKAIFKVLRSRGIVNEKQENDYIKRLQPLDRSKRIGVKAT